MCGRFVSARERQQLLDEFGVERDEVTGDLVPDYNVAPTDSIYAVMARAPRENRDAPAVRELHVVRWGLIPSWARDLSGAGRLINARAETLTVKPSFRNAFARRRCLIPADGYYEWRALEGRDGGKPRKQPYYIHRAPAASDALETRPVSTAVNSVRNDGPDLITPVTPAGEPGKA
jgi:putative SOS response-associated peptidase YedK